MCVIVCLCVCYRVLCVLCVRTVCVCAVCGWRFATDAALAAHMEGWQPVAEHLTHACAHCCATFGSERAKKQHENFCSGGDAAAGATNS